MVTFERHMCLHYHTTILEEQQLDQGQQNEDNHDHDGSDRGDGGGDGGDQV